MGVALLLAVGDGPGGEERGPAFPDLVEEVLLVLDVEVGLLLPGEAGVGEVLGGGAGPDGDESDLALGDEEPVPRGDLLLQVVGDGAGLEDLPDLLGGLCQAVVGGPVDPGELLLDLGHEVSAGDEVVVGFRGEDEGLGNGEPCVGEFAEIGSLTSDYRYVFNVQFVNIHNLSVHWEFPVSCKRFGGTRGAICYSGILWHSKWFLSASRFYYIRIDARPAVSGTGRSRAFGCLDYGNRSDSYGIRKIATKLVKKRPDKFSKH